MKRRMLALLLVLCLLVSNLALGVSAQETGSEGVLASKSALLNKGAKDSLALKAVDALDVDLLNAKLPECIQELRTAGKEIAAEELVCAYVVMEDAPLADTYTSKAHVPAGLSQQKLQKQNNVIAAIESTVLGGEKLNVRYQFTYLTNSISIETEFANLEKIAQLDGVKSVFLMPVYNAIPTDETASPNTAGSAAMTGVDMVWDELGYTGKGMKIAVIDTGLDLDHPAFAAAPAEASMTSADVSAVLRDLNAYALSAPAASSLYRSAKVPFAYNYADRNLIADHSQDDQSDHGTHVSGIAAANAVAGQTAKGMAPDAQIIVMKVFGATRAGYNDDIVAALEDAMTLGCDVVNLSLGSPAGFTTTDTEIDLIYERLAEQEIVACISAGNEDHSGDYNMWGTDISRTANPDNGVVGEPGVYHNVLTVASADNAGAMADYFTVGNDKIFYQDNAEYLYGDISWSLRDLAGEELEYVIIDGLGNEEEFYNGTTSLVDGKVAVVMRGELSFSDKVLHAEEAGAVACLIWNNNDTDDIYSFGMVTENEETGYIPTIPVALITMADGTLMGAAEEQTMVVAEDMALRNDPNGGQVSSFSSWGVAPDLTLEPDITGVGGNVYSTLDNGQYGLMSGTSMSSPQLAGITALVMERLYEEYPNEPAGTLRNMAEAILMSTANPIWGDYAETSPRQQGAGLVDAYQAMNTKTYLTVDGGKPKASLGDSANGSYSFTFEIHNDGDVPVSYSLGYTMNTEYAVGAEISATEVEYFMYGFDFPLEGEASASSTSITVPALSTASVTVELALTAEDKAYFDECWENGGYVNGYIYLYNANEEGEIIDELSLPYLGFYGDWTQAPVFDTAYWYDNSFWNYAPATGLPEGDMYWHIPWMYLGNTEWVPGFNPYTNESLDENGKLIYDPAHNVVSPNGDGYLDYLDDLYLSLLRNAKTLTMTWSVDGEAVYTEVTTNNSKTMFIPNYGQVVPWIYSWYGWGLYDFTDENGDVLPSGTEVLLTIDAEVDYGDGGEHSIEIPFTVDTEAGMPVAARVLVDDLGSRYLELQLTDDVAVAAAFLIDYETEETLSGLADLDMEKQADGSYLAYFDITNLGDHFYVGVCDYGTNEAYYELDLSSAEEDPMDPTDPTDPDPTDPTDPEPTDPTDPEPTDPTDPEPTDPVDEYDLYVGGVGMTDGDYLAVGATSTTTSKPSGGYAHYKNGKLYFHDYSYRGQGMMYDAEYDYYAIVVSYVDLEIVLEGENTLTQADTYSDHMFIVGELNITGSGTMTTNGGYYSIWAATGSSTVAFDMDGGSWIARDGMVGIEGGIAEVYSGTVDMEVDIYGFAMDIVEVYGGSLSLKALSMEEAPAGYISPCALVGDLRVADGLEVQASVNPNGPLGEFNAEDQLDYHWVKVADPEDTDEPTDPTDPEPTDPTDPEPTDPTDPEPTDPVVDYDVYVGGVGMNDGDYLAVGADETTTYTPDEGYAYYRDGLLVLYDYSYSGVGYVYDEDEGLSAVIYSDNRLNIALDGVNNLTQTDDQSACIYSPKGITFNDGGELNVSGGFYGLLSSESNGDISIAVDGGTVNVENCEIGIQTNQGACVYVSGGVPADCTLNVEANRHAIHAEGGSTSIGYGTISLKATSTESSEYCAVVGSLGVSNGLAVKASDLPTGPLGNYYEARLAEYNWITIGEAEEPSETSVIRLAGANRYATGFAIADYLKELRGVDKFESVIVAYGQNFPDALTGSYLASVKGAPILLTEPAMDPSLLLYLYENLEEGGKVYILGGTAAVSNTIEVGAKAMGFEVERLKGKDRYGTNLEILREAGVHPADEILIATGTNYADSLSASATGLPILLVGDKLTDAQKSFLESTSKYFIILGGTGAVSAEVEAELRSLGGYVERVKGTNRYGTSVAIAERFFRNANAAVLAYSHGFPDGLCGGPLAMEMDAPLILTSNDSFWQADDYVEGMTSGVVTGGTGRISDAVVREIFDLPSGTPIERP